MSGVQSVNGSEFNSSNCDIHKSLRIEKTDDKVLDTVIEIVKNSKELREGYKVKSLTLKWEDENEIKKTLEPRYQESNKG